MFSTAFYSLHFNRKFQQGAEEYIPLLRDRHISLDLLFQFNNSELVEIGIDKVNFHMLNNKRLKRKKQLKSLEGRSPSKNIGVLS